MLGENEVLSQLSGKKQSNLPICLQVWELVEPHMMTMSDMEELDPDALRHCLKTPTGITINDSEDECNGDEKPTYERG